MDDIAAHEHEITEYALERLEEIPGVKLFGPSADKKGGVAAFTLKASIRMMWRRFWTRMASPSVRASLRPAAA
jgi:selenocysteine lyase/cysteine desulfurase